MAWAYIYLVPLAYCVSSMGYTHGYHLTAFQALLVLSNGTGTFVISTVFIDVFRITNVKALIQ